MTFILIFWIAVVPPAVPQRLLFGPFDSMQQCEDTYTWARQHYIGGGPIQHECRAAKS